MRLQFDTLLSRLVLQMCVHVCSKSVAKVAAFQLELRKCILHTALVLNIATFQPKLQKCISRTTLALILQLTDSSNFNCMAMNP